MIKKRFRQSEKGPEHLRKGRVAAPALSWIPSLGVPVSILRSAYSAEVARLRSCYGGRVGAGRCPRRGECPLFEAARPSLEIRTAKP
jgi:hypothetical protein